MIEDVLQDPKKPTTKLLELLFVNHGSGLPPAQPTAKDWFWMVNDRAPPKIEDIKRAVCRHFNVSIADLLCERRDHAVLYPRQVGMYVARSLTQKGLDEIARRFNRADHTVSRSAIQKIERLVKEDWKVAYDVAHLEDAFQ